MNTLMRAERERGICRAKKSYPCRMAAESALAKLRCMANVKHCPGLYDEGSVYLCPWCSQWHITRRPQREEAA
jgi:hypothetical protein